MTPHALAEFIRESNRIEGIVREPTIHELAETEAFLKSDSMTVVRLKSLVAVYAPHARLRDKAGLNVRVGNHVPPPGGPEIRERLKHFLDGVNSKIWVPFEAHVVYETLHPFTDGNGRSGRAIWLWQMRRDGEEARVERLGFKHAWYYQSLQACR